MGKEKRKSEKIEKGKDETFADGRSLVGRYQRDRYKCFLNEGNKNSSSSQAKFYYF